MPANSHPNYREELDRCRYTLGYVDKSLETTLVKKGRVDSDLEKVERVTIEVAREVMQSLEGGVPEFEPLVRYHTFGDSGIHFNVLLRGRHINDQYPLKHALIKRLHRRYREEGIEIPFPTRTLHIR